MLCYCYYIFYITYNHVTVLIANTMINVQEINTDYATLNSYKYKTKLRLNLNKKKQYYIIQLCLVTD